MIDPNTLVILRDAFQRNCCVEVLYGTETLTLIPHELTRENGKIYLYARKNTNDTVMRYAVEDFNGVMLDLLTQVPSDLPWDKKFIESRSFAIKEEKSQTHKLISYEEQETHAAEELAEKEKQKFAKRRSDIEATTPKKKKKGIIFASIGIAAAVALTPVALQVFNLNDNNKTGGIFAGPSSLDPNSDDFDYSAWRQTVKDEDLATNYKQSIPLDNAEYSGEVNDNVNVDLRMPYEAGPESNQYSESWKSIYSDKDVLSSKNINYRLKSDVTVENELSLRKAYNSQLKCMIQGSPNDSIRSKTFISNNNLTNNDRSFTDLLVKEMLAEMKVDSPISVEEVQVYQTSTRDTVTFYDVKATDELSFVIRGFSGNGNFVYFVNNCGLNFSEITEGTKFPVEMHFYTWPAVDDGSGSHRPQPE
jgi:hypothetical protein